MSAQQQVAVSNETREAAPAQSETAAILSMIERAAKDPNVDMDKFERLMAMRERAEAQFARQAYASAFAEMQAELKPIPRLGKGHNDKTYARWEDVNELIRPILAAHDFSLSFRTKDAANGIEITAVLLHRAGHAEETTKTFPADGSGNKNAIQALGSSISYGKRYTAVALLNLTTVDEDDDGTAAGAGEKITDAQAASLRGIIEEVHADIRLFCKFFGVDALSDLPAARYSEAVAKLQEKQRRASK